MYNISKRELKILTLLHIQQTDHIIAELKLSHLIEINLDSFIKIQNVFKYIK